MRTLTVGVNDDAGKDTAQAGWFYATAGAEGLQNDSITLRWDDGSPTTVPDQEGVQRALALAAANGVTIELDLFPLHSQVFTGAAGCATSTDPEACGDTAKIQQFAAWTGQVAQHVPDRAPVRRDERVQPAALRESPVGPERPEPIRRDLRAGARRVLRRPQGREQRRTSCGASGSRRAATTTRPPRATRRRRPSTFLRDLGAWFHAFVAKTGRTTPLMDGLDFHPYPIPQSLPFSQGYATPNEATVSNLPRIYQAFYDGFNGTPQRTIGQQAGGGLPLSLNEVGIQTDSTGHAGYVGTETSANAAGGVIGQFATESYQATWYSQMLDLLACDPNVKIVNIYHLIDEAGLAGLAERPLLRRPHGQVVCRGRPRLDREHRRRLSRGPSPVDAGRRRRDDAVCSGRSAGEPRPDRRRDGRPAAHLRRRLTQAAARPRAVRRRLHGAAFGRARRGQPRQRHRLRGRRGPGKRRCGEGPGRQDRQSDRVVLPLPGRVSRRRVRCARATSPVTAGPT